ncbi:O-antigen ligase family protein [bacterium]|nr:MAG: O-antigen ligase family protein [bacterium]
MYSKPAPVSLTGMALMMMGLYLFCVPFFMASYMQKLLLAAVAFAYFDALVLRRIKPGRDELAVFGFSLWALALIFTMPLDGSTEYIAIRFFSVFAVYSLTKRLAISRRRWMLLGLCYIAGCFIAAGLVLYSWLLGESIAGRFTVEGLNANYVAYCLATAVPVVISLYWSSGRARSIGLAVFSVAVFGFAIVLTGSRGAVGALVAALGIFCLYQLRSRMFVGVLTAAAVMAASYGAFLLVPEETQMRLMGDFAGGSADVAFTGRLEVWPYALKLYSENPIFGVGPGAFAETNPLLIGAHNVFLSVAVETGTVGLVLFVIATVICARRARYLSWGHWGKWSMFVLLAVWTPIAFTGIWETAPASWFAWAWTGNIALLFPGERETGG